MNVHKTCPICRLDKLLSEYYVRAGRVRRDGTPSYQHGCKACRRTLTLRWQASHPERTRTIARKASRRYYARHKDALCEAARLRRAA